MRFEPGFPGRMRFWSNTRPKLNLLSPQQGVAAPYRTPHVFFFKTILHQVLLYNKELRHQTGHQTILSIFSQSFVSIYLNCASGAAPQQQLRHQRAPELIVIIIIIYFNLFELRIKCRYITRSCVTRWGNRLFCSSFIYFNSFQLSPIVHQGPLHNIESRHLEADIRLKSYFPWIRGYQTGKAYRFGNSIYKSYFKIFGKAFRKTRTHWMGWNGTIRDPILGEPMRGCRWKACGMNFES